MKFSAIVVAGVLFMGCTMAKISGRGPNPLILNNPTQKTQVIDHFTLSKRITFDYTSSFDVSDLVGDEMRLHPGGDAVTNLVITVRSDVGDFFINLFTLGLAASKTFQVEGDLVKIGSGTGQLVREGMVLGKAAIGEPLTAHLADFGGGPGKSPIVARSADSLVLVRR